MTPLNLIPRHMIGRHAARRALRAWSATAGAYAALAAVACIVVTIPVGADNAAVQADLQRLAGRVEKADKNRAAAEKAVAELRKRLASARAVGEHPDWSVLLAAMARARADEVALESTSIQTAKLDAQPPSDAKVGPDSGAKKSKPQKRTQYTVKIAGHADGPGGVFAYARRLEQMGFFDAVTVKDTRVAGIGSLSTTRFEIEAVLTEGVVAAGSEPAR